MADASRSAAGAEKDDPRESSQNHQPSLPTPRTDPDPDFEEGRRDPPDPRPAERQDD